MVTSRRRTAIGASVLASAMSMVLARSIDYANGGDAIIFPYDYGKHDPKTKFHGRSSYRPKTSNPKGTTPGRGLRRIKGR